MHPFVIAPSILSADLLVLGAEVNAVLAGGADWIHVDVMDNHYVPNLSFGPAVCEALRRAGVKAPLDVHLMVQPVNPLIAAFANAGASRISFHPEASEDLEFSLTQIREFGCQAGLVFNPDTPLEGLELVWDKLDMILLMSVNPGFSGQPFISAVLERIKQARALIDDSGRSIRLAVDGGVTLDNIQAIARAGADTFVAGSAIFSTPDYGKTVKAFRKALDMV